MGGVKWSGKGNGVARIRSGVRDRTVSFACRIAGAFSVAAHHERIRPTMQNRGGHGLCRSSSHDKMDSTHHGRSAYGLAPERFYHLDLSTRSNPSTYCGHQVVYGVKLNEVTNE